jgi:hypothetical protein
MLASVIMSSLAGGVLSKFRWLALVPAVSLALVIVCANGVATGASVWSTLLSAAVHLTALQIGFVVGGIAVHLRPYKGRKIASEPTSGREQLSPETMKSSG